MARGGVAQRLKRAGLARPPTRRRDVVTKEHSLSKKAEEICHQIVDLKIPSSRLRPRLEYLLGLRDSLITSFTSVKAETPGTATRSPGAPVVAAADISWKNELHKAISNQLRRSPNKGEVEYSHQEVQTENGVLFVGTVSCPCLSHSYRESSDTARSSESLAAKNALINEFPHVYESLVSPNSKTSVGHISQMSGGVLDTASTARHFNPSATSPTVRTSAPSRASSACVSEAPWRVGVKRKLEGPTCQEDPKCRLMSVMQLLVGRALTKGEVLFETVPVPGQNTLISTVELLNYGNVVYEGEPSETRKMAENSAAAAALEQLEPVVAPLEDEQKAKKLRQSQEKWEHTLQLS